MDEVEAVLVVFVAVVGLMERFGVPLVKPLVLRLVLWLNVKGVPVSTAGANAATPIVACAAVSVAFRMGAVAAIRPELVEGDLLLRLLDYFLTGVAAGMGCGLWHDILETLRATKVERRVAAESPFRR